jgi:hypothetical protein
MDKTAIPLHLPENSVTTRHNNDLDHRILNITSILTKKSRLRSQNIREAIAIELYPQSINVWDGLLEKLEKAFYYPLPEGKENRVLSEDKIVNCHLR